MWEDETLLGCGALKRLSADHGEVKSMHTAQAMRRRGAGSAMLRHLIAAARADGMSRLSLETGSWDYFRPAQALYRSHGFVECPPFADYVLDPNSVFMTLDLSGIVNPKMPPAARGRNSSCIHVLNPPETIAVPGLGRDSFRGTPWPRARSRRC